MTKAAAWWVVGLGLALGALAQAQDRVTLTSGVVRTGRIRDAGRNYILLEMAQSTDRIAKRDIARVQLGRPEPGENQDSDRIELKGGRRIAGDVRVSPDGKLVIVRVPGAGEASYPREEVVRIIPRGEGAAERPSAGPEELAAQIAALVGRLGREGADADAAEKELRALGIFAVEPLGEAAKTAAGDAARRIRVVLRSHELRKVVGDELDKDLPEIYEGIEAPQPEDRIEALRAALLVAPEDAVALVLFVLEDPVEDAAVRSFCVELLRRLNRYRELVEAYQRADAGLALALAIALGENGVHIGIPCLISALQEDDRRLRALAGEKLKACTGEDYLPAEDAPEDEWKQARERYQAWWLAHRDVIMERTKAMTSHGPQATPQRTRAIQYWERGAEQTAEEEYAAAEKSFRQALDEDPSYARAALSLGILLYRHQRRPAEAVECLERVASGRYPDAIDDVYAFAMYHLGVIRRELGGYKDAAEWFTRAIETRKNYIEAYTALGDTYYEWALMSDKLPAARRKEILAQAEAACDAGLRAAAAYEKDLVVMPVDPALVKDDGAFSRRDYLQSLKTLRDSLAGSRTAFAVNLVRIYLIQGALDKAEARAREAAAQDPSDVNLQIVLARVFERKGDTASALRHYRAALRLDPRNETATHGIFRLGGTVAPREPSSEEKKK